VYVNPTPNNVASVTLPQASRQLTHGNLLSVLDTLPLVSSISLSGLNAAILLKTVVVPVVDIIAPSTPAGLSASAISSSQINVSWSASTDNVGVTGYRVYRAGTLLATLGAVTTYQNAGLTPSTSFSYTVLAIDAAGNASAQSASASATTQAALDTTAPSVPGGLTAAAASSSQINLSWSASTDNVGVTGYKVFRNGVQIATTSALAYANTGLLPATTYSFAVAAFDAAGNSSAQSAAVSKRTLAVRVARDFNGDGRSDILWRNSTTGENVIWLMNGAAISSSVTFATVADPNWSIAGVGDFNGDGKSDILWHHRATGENAIWLMNGAAISSGASIAAVTDLNWSIAGVGDFNGDGKSDILWRNSTTGENAVYFMNGAAISSAAGMNAMTDLNWSIAGVGDFDADGKSDVLWHNNVTGENIVWLMNGTTLLSSGAVFSTVADLSWSIAAVGDVDGDGKSDILWRNSTTGENTVWFMSGASISSGAPVNAVQGSWSTVR
jgi:chitodextrinase